MHPFSTHLPCLISRQLVLFALLSTLTCLFPLHAEDEALSADLNEAVTRLPVTVTVSGGQRITGSMLLTTYKPAGPGPFPVAIVNHGRATEKRELPARQRMQGLAAYFVRRGFAVFVPTRLGYGDSGVSPDPEFSGACNDRDYAGSLRPAVEEIAATLEYARSLPYVDGSRHVVAGQSVGGIATVAYAARNPEGLLGYVNFAGGAGGNPVLRPGTPCQPERLSQLYAEYGQTTRAPGLWIYTKNDQFFAPQFTQEWYQSFTKGSAPTQFLLRPAFGRDGHQFMAQGSSQWRPLLDEFFGRFGIRPATTVGAPPATGFAEIGDPTALPWSDIPVQRDAGYRAFLASDKPRAFAISRNGHWAWSSQLTDPMGSALAYCERLAKTPCTLYAVDDAVVWRDTLTSGAGQ